MNLYMWRSILLRRGSSAFSTLDPILVPKSLPTRPTSSGLSSRSFHATPLSCHALRRRSRRLPTVTSSLAESGTDDDREEGANDGDPPQRRLGHRPVTEAELFSASATALIDKLYTSIRPMERVNDPFFLTKGLEDDVGPFLLLDFGPLHGQYVVQVDLEQSLVTMTTPRSGQIAYMLSDTSKEWISVADGHILEGMLVRELLHHAQGLPNL